MKLVVLIPETVVNDCESVLQTVNLSKFTEATNTELEKLISSLNQSTGIQFSTYAFDDIWFNCCGSIASLSGDVLIVQDLDGNIIYTNNPDFEFEGITSKINDVLGDATGSHRLHRVSDIYSYETHIPKSDSYYQIITKYDEQKNDNHILSIAKNITPRRQLENQIRWAMGAMDTITSISRLSINDQDIKKNVGEMVSIVNSFISPDICGLYWIDVENQLNHVVFNNIPSVNFSVQEFIECLSREFFSGETLISGKHFSDFNFPPSLEKSGVKYIMYYSFPESEVRGGFFTGRIQTRSGFLEKNFIEQFISIVTIYLERHYIKNKLETRARKAKKSEERLRTIITASPYGLLFLTPEGDVVEYNENILKIFDIPSITDPGFRSFLSDKFFMDLTTCIRLAGNISNELEYTSSNKTGKFLRYQLYPVISDVNEISGIQAVFEDITNSKTDSIEKESLKQQLFQSQKMELVGRLAAGIAHDFNNLLTVISGNVDLTRMDIDPSDPLQPSLEEIEHAAKRARELASRLLSFSRKDDSPSETIDLSEVATGIIKNVSRMIGEHISIRNEAKDPGMTVRINGSRMEQTLLNLVLNARDAMIDGGIIVLKCFRKKIERELTIRNRHLPPDTYVVFEVSDNGPGMPVETAEKVFEPFFTTKPAGHGTGLGLSTVVEIIESAGGAVSLTTSPGAGANFRIYLPFHSTKTMDSRELKTLSTLHRGTESVLIVEDEEIVRKVNRKILEKAGYIVIEAENGLAALELIHKSGKSIDLIITDIVMPLMNGYELANRITREKPEQKFIFVSGYSEDFMENTSNITLNSLNFLRKPYLPELLTSRVRDILDTK
ncbi:response regulator [Myxococcota bacterium]|nr:response regulator [Myxococcota bacterium]MBU1380192.1 response regulator [Myxococcota bacterium]MBU1497342.1 response regulator [Myxococcota bacterium]